MREAQVQRPKAGVHHPDVVAALRKEGLFALAAPAELGGGGASGSTQLAVFEAMAHADSSAGGRS